VAAEHVRELSRGFGGAGLVSVQGAVLLRQLFEGTGQPLRVAGLLARVGKVELLAVLRER
jgi:hypothetical protein